ncbi:SIS domain-containing protein [Pararhizobium mangrovi]|uniref:SIS domain-containing protein n=2 Tax=Pararhizobium mangrovi TaxID=2590452 RepID=A0A506U9N4_9HYPH|nr:SIS domain-containing protein [Pararhizobium mangrovi]
MRREIEEIPAAVTRLLERSDADLRAAGALLAERDPAVLVTVARGSSDHAATFLKYACEITAGVPVASLGPSIASIYHAKLRLERAGCLAVSQSGQSPDIVAMAKSVREAGAATVALTNVEGSPLAAACDGNVALQAGPEKSVAATKSFVTAIVAGLAILGHWRADDRLLEALSALPQHFEAAIACDWSAFVEALSHRDSLFVLGRGPAAAIAAEAALKFKETCGMHAEAYSAAEVLHGPVAIVGKGFPVLGLVARDAAEESAVDTLARIEKQGGSVFATTGRIASGTGLPFVETGHALTDALALSVSFYGFVEALARSRGLDPDSPPHLRKVTETV